MSKRKKESPQLAGPYDRIWRENMNAALPGIIEKVFKIKVVESRDLPDKVLITKQREVDLSQIPYKLFLSSRHPEERLLAILGDFEGEDPELVLTSIIKQVRQSAKEDFSENRYLQQLRILIQLRNLAKQFDKVMEKVSKFFKEERDPFFQRGVRKGIEQGREVGLEEGREEGREEGIEMKNRRIVQNLITELGLSDEQTAKVAEVPIEFVREIRKSVSES